MFFGGNPFGAEARAIYRAGRNRQPDPDLERMRREMGRTYRHFLYWVFGFPAMTIGVVALLMLTTVSAHTTGCPAIQPGTGDDVAAPGTRRTVEPARV